MSGDEDPQRMTEWLWAQSTQPLLEKTFLHFKEDREWPTIERLQHDLEVAGSDVNVGQVTWDMPSSLGHVDQQRLVLLARALTYVPAAAELLQGWHQALRLAYRLWFADPDAVLRRQDLLGLFSGDRERVALVSRLLFREGWAFSSAQGGADDDWRQAIRSDVRIVREAESAEEILSARRALENQAPAQPLFTMPEIPGPQIFPRPVFELDPIAGDPEPPPKPRIVKRVWGTLSQNPLYAGVLATVIGGLILVLLTQDSDSDPVSTTEGPTAVIDGAWVEQAGTGGARAFGDPGRLGDEGPRVQPNQFVQIECKLYLPRPPSVVPDGYWYRLASGPWNGRYWAPANSFWNGDQPGQRPYTHDTDFAVDDCDADGENRP